LEIETPLTILERTDSQMGEFNCISLFNIHSMVATINESPNLVILYNLLPVSTVLSDELIVIGERTGSAAPPCLNADGIGYVNELVSNALEGIAVKLFVVPEPANISNEFKAISYSSAVLYRVYSQY